MFDLSEGQQSNVAVSGFDSVACYNDLINPSPQAYIEQKYQIKLQYPQLPCVQLTKIAWYVATSLMKYTSMLTEKSHYRYPLECVSILPGTQFLGKLSPEQVTEMLKFTTMKPREALSYLREGIQHLRLGQENRLLQAWNLQVSHGRPISAKARVLDPPDVTYAEYVDHPTLNTYAITLTHSCIAVRGECQRHRRQETASGTPEAARH